MVEVRNKGSEPVESLLRRFSKRWQQSGIGRRDRKRRYYSKPETRRERRLRALYRISVQKERERLKKLGRLEEEKNRFMAGKIGKAR
jgi:ribosomal protein S21